MTIEIVVAFSNNFAIGKDNQLLWHIPDDLKRFKELTSGHTVIMGRNTWESLPEKVRPLPNRQNIVVTRNSDYSAPGAYVVNSLSDAFRVSTSDRVFVIGGGQIYQEVLPFADILHITQVHDTFEADTYFPPINFYDWNLVSIQKVDDSQCPFSFITLQRKQLTLLD